MGKCASVFIFNFCEPAYHLSRLFWHEDKANSTEISKYIWSLQNHSQPFVNGSELCNLCLTEKFYIINSNEKLLNKRSELTSTCRHMNKHLLKKHCKCPTGLFEPFLLLNFIMHSVKITINYFYNFYY